MDDNIDAEGEILTCEDLSTNKGLTIAYWNIRSFFNKFEEFVHCLNSTDAEIFCLGESWMTDQITTDMISVEGYNIARADRDKNSAKSKGGGLLLYYKQGLKVFPIDQATKCTRDYEILTVRLELTGVKEIYYLFVYRPPDGDIVTYINDVEPMLYTLTTKTNYEVNLIGDININLNKTRDANVKRYKDFMKRNNLVNIISMDTCFKVTGD